MALCWGLACGFESPLPYFYCVFFTGMILHRQTRDEVRCKEKYGEFWDIYVREVPNVFLPGPKFFAWLLNGAPELPPIYIPPELVEETKRADERRAAAKRESARPVATPPASPSPAIAEAQNDDSEPESIEATKPAARGRGRKPSSATKAPKAAKESRAATPTRGRAAKEARSVTPSRTRTPSSSRKSRVASPSPSAKKTK